MDEEDSSFRPSSDGSSSSPSSSSSSADSVATEREHRSPDTATQKARKETKTQALARVDNRINPNDPLPLLLDANRPSRQSRPEAPDPEGDQTERTASGEGEEETAGVNLDLESLNLLDKAIAPGKLIKGEKIGSGGFKDV